MFHLRNISLQPITFVSETGRQGDSVRVIDELGKEVEVQSAFYTGWPIDVAWKLLPGEEAQLSLLTPGLGSLDQPGTYKVRYTIRFNSRIQRMRMVKSFSRVQEITIKNWIRVKRRCSYPKSRKRSLQMVRFMDGLSKKPGSRYAMRS